MTLAETTQKPDFTTLEWPSQNSMKMKISQFVSLDPYSTAPYKYTSKPAKLDCRPSSFLSTLFSSFFSLLFSTFLSQRCFGQHISTTLFVFIQKGHSEVIFSFRPGKFLPAGAEGCVQGVVFFFLFLFRNTGYWILMECRSPTCPVMGDREHPISVLSSPSRNVGRRAPQQPAVCPSKSVESHAKPC